MKNIFMIIIDIVRMPVFFIYCIISWLSRIDSCKAFRCFMYQIFIQLALMMSYVVFYKDLSKPVGITMILTIVITAIVGYIVIGKPSNVDEWNYILGSTKVVDKNVSDNYVRILDREVVQEVTDDDNDLSTISFRETKDNQSIDIVSESDKDIVKSTITLEDLTGDSECNDVIEEDVVSDEDIEQMLTDSMNNIFNDDLDNNAESDITQDGGVDISGGTYNSDSDSSSIELPDMDISQDFGSIELINNDADIVKSGSSDFRLDNIDEAEGSVLTSMIDDDEEI